MFRFIYSIICILVFSVNSHAQIEWEHAPGTIGEADLAGIAISPDGTWYVTGKDHLYSSVDSGKIWKVEIEFGIHDNIRNLKFFSDGTPVFSSNYDMVIKKEGAWIKTIYPGDFVIYNDTLFSANDGDVFLSADRGETWSKHIDMVSYRHAYKYRRQNGRHYLEFGIGTSRLIGEVSLQGEVLKSMVVGGYAYFTIDSCDNLHFFSTHKQSILYEDGDDEYNTFSGANHKFLKHNDNLYRLSNGDFYRNVNCSLSWEFISTVQGAIDFFPVGLDTFLFVLEDHVAAIKLPNVIISEHPIGNGEFYSWIHEEVPDRTRYFVNKAGSHRMLPDSTKELLSFRLDQITFGPNGWLYKETGNLPTKQVLSKDRGVTWDSLPRPAQINLGDPVYPISEDIIAYASFDGTWIAFTDGSQYFIGSDSTLDVNHSYYRFKLMGDLILMNGTNPPYISAFNISTREFSPLLYRAETNAQWSGIDNEGTLFYLSQDEKVMTIVPYPYTNVQSIPVPLDHLIEAITVDKGCVMAHGHAINHFSKDLTITKIPLGIIGDNQLLHINYAKSGRWIAITNSEFQNTFITTTPFPTSSLGTPIKGGVYGSDDQCLNPILMSGTNWKLHMTKPGLDRVLIGQPNGEISFALPAGEYDLDVIPPSYSIWDSCQWPTHVTVIEGEPIEDLNITAKQKEACDAISLFVSAPFYRRCFDSKVNIDVRNLGATTLIQPKVDLILHPEQTIVSSPYSYTGSGNEYTFTLDDLVPGAFIQIPITIHTSCDISLGEVLCAHAHLSVDNQCPDFDYTSQLCMEAIGSWDPNDKQVTDEDGKESAQFKSNDFLYYKIRFQNTGTDTAFNIQIADATRYDIPEGINVIYMFNPFGEQTMKTVLENIIAYCKHLNKSIFLVYCNPVYINLFEEKKECEKLYECFFKNKNREMVIYNIKPQA